MRIKVIKLVHDGPDGPEGPDDNTLKRRLSRGTVTDVEDSQAKAWIESGHVMRHESAAVVPAETARKPPAAKRVAV